MGCSVIWDEIEFYFVNDEGLKTTSVSESYSIFFLFSLGKLACFNFFLSSTAKKIAKMCQMMMVTQADAV